jgi:multisubunit Na+/H+ antiporter MnhF subunit
VNVVAVAVVVLAMVASILLVLPATRRTGLGTWHPAAVWILLEIVFFGVGSAFLATIDGRSGTAYYVAGSVVIFGLAVAMSDRLSRRRALPGRAAGEPGPASSPPTRLLVVVILAALGVVALLPTLIAVGIPFLAGDITGARSEVGGIDLQVLRVALPAAVLVAVVGAVRAPSRRTRIVAIGAFGVAFVAELALASRYLSAELLATIVIGLALVGRPIPTRVLAVVGLVGAVLFVSVGILRAYDQAAGRELDFAIERTVNRVILIQPRTLEALQSAIPAEQPYFDGLTWLRRLGPVFGRPDIPNLGYWIYPRLFPTQTIPGYAAPGLVGEAWANFGWLGLAIFAALGILVERLGALFARRRAVTADIVAAALATLFIARTHALGVNGLAVLAVLIVVWRLLAAPLGDLGRDLRATAGWRI